MIDDPNGFDNLVSDSEWKILAQDEMTEEDLANKKHNDWIKKNDMKNNKNFKKPKKSIKPESKTKKDKDGESEKNENDLYSSDEYAEDEGEVE